MLCECQDCNVLPRPWSLSVYRPQRGPVAARIRLVFDRLVEYFGEGGRFP